MKDIELIESAAKAAGLKFSVRFGVPSVYDPSVVSRHHANLHALGWKCWNPLADDAQAFRLAVDLKLDLSTVASDTGDYAETRRNIVIAAAETYQTQSSI